MTKDPRQTWEGLRAEGDAPTLAVSESDKLARDIDADAAAREEAKWRALFETGLVNLDAVPVRREELAWRKCDDVEVRVLLRVRGNAKIGDLLVDATYSREQIVAAICRLASRGLLRLP